MHVTDGKAAWEKYCAAELEKTIPKLRELGYELEEKQVHIGGERYLMAGARDVGGGGRKLVLIGRRIADHTRVVIKVSSDLAGMREIERERNTRHTLHGLEFASRAFYLPEELLFFHRGSYLIYITAYVEEARSFFEHSLDEQFFLALQALERQEGVHATTSKHASVIRDSFGITTAEKYVESYQQFAREALAAAPGVVSLAEALHLGEAFLREHQTVVARYCGFLTHADFVPNNLRVSGTKLFLLDYASMHFGNKYESWARFINFMVHHNPALEELLVRYVRDNRGEEEYLSLRLMRVYKIAFLLQYHAKALHQSSGNLHALIEQRLILWTAALTAVLEDKPIPPEVVETYVQYMEQLRSDEEKARQREMLGQQVRV